MIILACETSTLLGSVAISQNGRLLAAEESPRQGSHSEALNVLVDQALATAGKKLSDVDLFATGTGPGSFTGIRISLNSVKSFAYCEKKAAAGVNSLYLMAAALSFRENPSEFENIPVISMINAYKNMVYVATHRLENGRVLEVRKPEVLRVQNLDTYVTEKSLVCGDGFSTYEKYFSARIKNFMLRDSSVADAPHAKTLALVAEDPVFRKNWNELVPLYLRASEAEENLQGIKYQPLI